VEDFDISEDLVLMIKDQLVKGGVREICNSKFLNRLAVCCLIAMAH
jgi:hypothetical protein